MSVCERLSALQFVAHRGQTHPHQSSKVLTTEDLRNLVRRKVFAADLDIFFSSEDTLWVGHPKELQALWSTPDVFLADDEDIRRWSRGYLMTLPKLLSTSVELNLTLFLELKGLNMPQYTKQFSKLMQMVAYHSMQAKVIMWVPSSDKLAAVRTQYFANTGSKSTTLFKFGKPLYDQGAHRLDTGELACEDQIHRDDAGNITMLAPNSLCLTPRLLGQAEFAPWARGAAMS